MTSDRKNNIDDSVFVSIVVAARNEGKRIDRCLDSLEAQCYRKDRYEIIVVDNGSEDDTAARAANHKVQVVSEKIPGPAAARNAGIDAARGEIIAFIDADAVAESGWLSELLNGREDSEIGCFVGEIAPMQPAGFIAQYVHDRKMICQQVLLSSTPSVAAAGNIAYRKSVFETVGSFDQTFRTGEDGDLFRRMTLSGSFQVRYNPGALVMHAHPATLGALAKRSFGEGRGLGRFRIKHRENLPKRLSSPVFASVGILKIVFGCCLYPLRALCMYAKGNKLRKSLVYPVLDKLHSGSRALGVLFELIRRRGKKKKSILPLTEVRERGFIDQLEADLSLFPLTCDDSSDIAVKLRQELREFVRDLAGVFPGSSVVLTGSLFAGEGQIRNVDGREVLISDADIFVVTPRLRDAVTLFAAKKVKRLQSKPSCINTDIGFVWRMQVKRRRTTLGGAVVGGDKTLCKLLAGLETPRAFSSLLRAYNYLVKAALDSENSQSLYARALVRAARSMMLANRESLQRERWISLSSLKALGLEFEQWRSTAGSDIVDAVQGAVAFLLGDESRGADCCNHSSACRVLGAAAQRVVLRGKGVLMVKHFLWLLKERRFGIPSRKAGLYLLEAFQRLAESRIDGGFDAGAIAAAEHVATKLFFGAQGRDADDPSARYANLYTPLMRLATYNPHRLVLRNVAGGA